MPRVITAVRRPVRLAPLSVTEAERDRMRKAAAAAGLSVAEWSRARLLRDEADEQLYIGDFKLSMPEKPVKAHAGPGVKGYPLTFLAVWNNTGKRGGKFAALKMWNKVGKPAWNDIHAAWDAYMLSEAPLRGAVMHLSTWLNGRCHEQEWTPGVVKPAFKKWGAPAEPPSPYCDYHRTPGSKNRESYAKKSTCPECKHVAALNGKREGEPSGFELPPWMGGAK